MKHSQTIGIIFCLTLFFFSTQPLVFIESQQWIITGWKTAESNYGQPGKFLRTELEKLNSPLIKLVRGRGLLNSIVINHKYPEVSW